MHSACPDWNLPVTENERNALTREAISRYTFCYRTETDGPLTVRAARYATVAGSPWFSVVVARPLPPNVQQRRAWVGVGEPRSVNRRSLRRAVARQAGARGASLLMQVRRCQQLAHR